MPGDIYSALTGQLPSDQESQQALIDALRGRNVMGQIGALSGDPVLAPFGANLMKSSDQQAEEVGKQYHLQAAQKMEEEYRKQQEEHLKQQDLRLGEQSDIGRQTLAETIREHDLANAQKMWALGIDPGTGKRDESWDKTVDQIGKLDRPPLNASATRNPRNFSIMEAVHEKYPDYHEDQYRNLQETTDAFSAKGRQGPLLKSADVGIHHLAAYDDQIDKLGTGSVYYINQGANWLKTKFGLSSAPNTLDSMKHIVSQEVEKFIQGGGTGAGALADRQALATDLDSAKSPMLLKDVTKKWRGLMTDQVNGLRQMWHANTYGRRGDIADNLSHETRQIMGLESPTSGAIDRFKGFSGNEITDESATPDNPKGQKGRPTNPPAQASDLVQAQ